MSIWYAIWDALPFEMLHWDFMKNALLALLLMAPLFGILSTMIVTGRMSFFSDALGHSAFTGIAIGIICGVCPAVFLCQKPLKSGGGYPDWRVFQLRRCAGHFRCHRGRRQLYPVQ